MKKSIFIILIGILILCLTQSLTMAEEKLPLTATASSCISISSYGPDKTVDGNTSTYWIGGYNQAPWWIMFDTGESNQIAHVNIKWLTTYYIPQDYDIQISSDAANWENVFTAIEGVYSTTGEVREINQSARYIRLYINSVTGRFPIMREFEAYKGKLVAVPHLMRFQGILKDAEEVPLDGTFTLTFRLYDVETEGLPLWEEVQDSINIEEGLLNIELGSVTPLDLPFEKQYWLSVQVESDEEMAPRFKLTSVPYALTSEN